MRKSTVAAGVLLVVSMIPAVSDGRPKPREERVIQTDHTNVNVIEGKTGATKTLTVRVEVDPPPAGGSYAADYEIVPVTATRGTDFDALIGKGEVRVDESDSTPTIPIKIIGDAADEVNETIRIDLFNARCTSSGPCDLNAHHNPPPGYVTIADDDGKDTPGPGMQNRTGFVDATQDSECLIEVFLDYGWDKNISVDYETADLEAERGDDYEKTQGTMVFSPGQIRKFVHVPVNEDRESSMRNERFEVRFSNAKGAELLEESSQCTLLDGGPQGAEQRRRRKRRG